MESASLVGGKWPGKNIWWDIGKFAPIEWSNKFLEEQKDMNNYKSIQTITIWKEKRGYRAGIKGENYHGGNKTGLTKTYKTWEECYNYIKSFGVYKIKTTIKEKQEKIKEKIWEK